MTPPHSVHAKEMESAVLLLFNRANQLALLEDPVSGRLGPTRVSESAGVTGECFVSWIESTTGSKIALRGPLRQDSPGVPAVFLGLIGDPARTLEQPGYLYSSLENLYRLEESQPERLEPVLHSVLPLVRDHALEIPYLNFRRHDYVYKFRSDRERNEEIYQLDSHSSALYQSKLCQAVKALRRVKENASSSPACLDFGAVRFYLPSHFGFCLGVRNAIERAYETLASNPGRRVFMLSELIHNPFVNEDLLSRGLRYLQTDRGVRLVNPRTGRHFWDELTAEDIVIIPAFGATNEDKVRLIEKGIPFNDHDATCMLVEKVWKAAKRYGEAGNTVVIHGKSEHEETKATFSNSTRYAPSIIVRNSEEACSLGELILIEDPDEKRRRFRELGLSHSDGFDPVRDLERIAVVNQTTLLRNETLEIIRLFDEFMRRRYGDREGAGRVNGGGKSDTLCYATQVNQDALSRVCQEDLDLAIVAGGRNSSNTYQLYRICRERLGKQAFYIQSEKNILSAQWIQHSTPTLNADAGDPPGLKPCPFFPDPLPDRPLHVLVTGGASCPDGIIQQIVTRICGFFPPERIRSLESVIENLVD